LSELSEKSDTIYSVKNRENTTNCGQKNNPKKVKKTSKKVLTLGFYGAKIHFAV